MITGLNTDVTYDGIRYHVQTEDLGEKRPVLLTLVYMRGAIVLREQRGYGEIRGRQSPTAVIKDLMQAQHREVVSRVAAGLIRPSSAPPTEATPAPSWDFSEPIAPPPKSVDELIKDYVRTRRRTTRC